MTDTTPDLEGYKSLSKREIEMLQHLCEGLTTDQIAAAMGLSPRTVDIHRARAMRKLNARNAAHVAVLFDRAHRTVLAAPSRVATA